MTLPNCFAPAPAPVPPGVPLPALHPFIETALRAAGWLARGGDVTKAITELQAWLGRPATGVLDAPTVEFLAEPRFCGHPDWLAIANPARRTDPQAITWRRVGSLPGLADAAFDAAIQAAFASWRSAGVDVLAAPTAGVADLTVATGGIDGRGSVLAWCELPVEPNRPQNARVDTSEAWVVRPGTMPGMAQMDLFRVLAHEFGHFFGLQHTSDRNDLMYPTVSATIDGPRPGDVNAMIQLGYKRVTATPDPPVPPTPGGDEPATMVILNAAGGETARFALTRVRG